jgi:hypothetical protein
MWATPKWLYQLPEKIQKGVVICYSLFVTRYLLLVIRYSLFVTRYLLLVICYSLFDIRYSDSKLRLTNNQ